MPAPIDAQGPVIEDVDKATNAFIWKNDKLLAFVYGIFVIAAIAIIFYFRLDFRWMVIPFVVGTVGYGHIKSKITRAFTQQFGASIGFSYAPTADMATVSGKLFLIGHSQSIYNVLSGIEHGRDSRIFSYRFTVGSGRSSHTYVYTVFETTFANMMPDIVLTCQADSVGDFSLFDESEHIKLEGDFNKYFSLKVPKGYEMEAYQIFPPDVMADLIDRAQGLNFEFNGNKLYIYATKLITVREKLQAMFDLAQYLDDLFNRSTRAVNVAPNPQI